jgi:hypothetical protein
MFFSTPTRMRLSPHSGNATLYRFAILIRYFARATPQRLRPFVGRQHQWDSKAAMLGRSALETIARFLRRRLRLLVFLVRMWLA